VLPVIDELTELLTPEMPAEARPPAPPAALPVLTPPAPPIAELLLMVLPLIDIDVPAYTAAATAPLTPAGFAPFEDPPAPPIPVFPETTEFVIDSEPNEVIADPNLEPPEPNCVVPSCARPEPPVERLPTTATPFSTSDPPTSTTAPPTSGADTVVVAFAPVWCLRGPRRSSPRPELGSPNPEGLRLSLCQCGDASIRKSLTSLRRERENPQSAVRRAIVRFEPQQA
jgi:hypothetical protein